MRIRHAGHDRRRSAVSAGACVSFLERAGGPAAASPPAKTALGIRPNGDTEIQPDMSQVHSEDLKKVYAYIDEHIDEHVENLQRWIRQPSISNSGEGIPESAEMVKGFFEQLGCQESRVYDVGTTEWGSQGNRSCTRSATRARDEHWSSTGCTTRCRSRSPMSGWRRRSKDV